MEFKKELEDLQERIAMLEAMAHPKRAFVTCEVCKKQIKELEENYKYPMIIYVDMNTEITDEKYIEVEGSLASVASSGIPKFSKLNQ